MRIYKNDMTTEQLEKVFETNHRLQEQVTNDYMEDMVMYTVSDYLRPLKHLLKNWSLGYGQRNELFIEDDLRLPYAVRDLQESYYFLSDEDYKQVERVIQEMEDYEDKDYEDDEDAMYSDLTVLEEESNDIRDMLIRRFDDLLRYPSKEEMKNYFLDFYVECRLDDDVFIDNGTYTLYHEVSYTEDYL